MRNLSAVVHHYSTMSKSLDTKNDKYQQSIIYGVVCLLTGEIYCGSTYQTLKERIQQHKRDRGCTVIQILDRGRYKEFVIEEYPCWTKRELRVREGYWQEHYRAEYAELLVNRVIEGKFYHENPHLHAQVKRRWYDKNIDLKKQRDKKRQLEKRDEICLRHKQYYEKNREEMLAKMKVDGQQLWTCEWCNKTIKKCSRSRHKSKWCKSKPVD